MYMAIYLLIRIDSIEDPLGSDLPNGE